MKKLLVISAITALYSISTTTLATTSPYAGFYTGLSGGWGFTNWKDVQNNFATGATAVTKDNGVVGRAFLGYSINRYFALDAGYSYFFNKAKITGLTNYSNRVKTQAIDFYGKGILPLVDSVDLYAKVGAGYLISNNLPSYDTNRNTIGTENHKAINVAFGAGIDYFYTPNIIANIEWTRINGFPTWNNGNTYNYQPNTDAFMFGLRYKFDL